MLHPLITALMRLEEALAVSTMLRHRRSAERKMRRLVRRIFREQAANVDSAMFGYLPKSDIVSASYWQAMEPVLASALSVSLAHLDAFAALLDAAYKVGGDDGDRELREDVQPPLTRDMRRRAAERIAGIDATTRELLQALIEQAIAENWAYTKLAARIRKTFKDFGRAVPQRHLRDRAELIAVTEIGQAYIDGQLDNAQRLVDRGAQIEKSWLTVGDDRVSDGCQSNQGAGWIAFANTFPSGHAAPLRFPGCRCALQTRRKVG